LLASVDNALKRIEVGTYGRCEECSQDIADERLDAIPYTPHCIKCAQRQENGEGP